MSNQPGLAGELPDTAVRCSPLVREPLTATQALNLSVVLKALADPVRLQLLSLIGAHAGGEACVCDISPAVDVSQPTVSHHLKVLREAGLLESERRASWVYYRVVPSALRELADAVQPMTADPTRITS